MAEQRNVAVHIGQLNLRIPGDGAESGHRIADGIVQGLEQRLPAGIRRHLGALSVRVEVPAGATEGDMREANPRAIVNTSHKGSG